MKTLIDFYADWCGPCIAMKPFVDQVEKDFKDKLTVRNVNVDEDSNDAAKYGVVSLPTFIILDEEGKVVAKRLGASPKDQFLEWVKANL